MADTFKLYIIETREFTFLLASQRAKLNDTRVK